MVGHGRLMNDTATFKPRAFAVVGAGPVGCTLAAHLAHAGFEVTLCDVNPDLVAPAINGITLEGAETLTAAVSGVAGSVDDLADAAPDVIFLTVKANATPLIASVIDGFRRDGMFVVSWQNGIDTERALADTLGEKPVLRAVVNYGCTLLEPCRVRVNFLQPPHYLQGMDPDMRHAAEGIAAALTTAGLATEVTDNIVSRVWRKSILNAAINPVCAMTGFTMARAMKDPIVFTIIDALIKECVRVARANEITLGWDFYRYAMAYLKGAGEHRPSMLADLSNHRPTEVDFINGKFVEYGRQAGIETPYNNTMRALVKALEP